MQYSFGDYFRNFMLQHRKIVVFFLCLIILSVFAFVFNEGYSMRTDDEFDEIQFFLTEIRKKDSKIHNSLEIVEVEKTVKGIDVSSWQGDINWEKVNDSGIDYVMIRCGYRNMVSDEIKEDKKFRRNIEEANRLGIPVGVYFYSTARNELEVLEEASFVLNLIKDYEVIYPVAYDFEMFNENRTEGVLDKRINDNAVRFLDYIRAHGYNGMLYSNLRALESHWDIELFKGYRLWYAQYAAKVTYEGEYAMWQYADNGRIDGIKGKVDLNESYIAYEVVK